MLAGCYCLAQPALGVNNTFAAAVNACELAAANTCALGCATMLGFQPMEGGVVDATTHIGVRCDMSGGPGRCVTFAK